eukprot:2773549-Alexandrium_andersonii.AAC.1
MRGRELEEAQGRSLGQFRPGDFQRALGGELELRASAECFLFAKRRLGLEQHRALARGAASDAPRSIDAGALASEAQGSGSE